MSRVSDILPPICIDITLLILLILLFKAWKIWAIQGEFIQNISWERCVQVVICWYDGGSGTCNFSIVMVLAELQQFLSLCINNWIYCTFETSSHASTAASLKTLVQGVPGSLKQLFPPSLVPGWDQTSCGSLPVPALILKASFQRGTGYKEK